MVVREFLARLGFVVDEKSERTVEQSIEGLKAAATQLAGIFISGLAARGLYRLVNETSELGDETAKTAIKLGVSAQALQELRHVAHLAGASNESLGAGLRFLGRNANEAAEGGAEMAQTFSKYGIAVKDANGQTRSAADLLPEIADAIAKIKSPSERTAVAMKLLGRGGTELIPMLIQGSAAIREQRKEAIALGGVMSGKLLAASEEYNDTQDRLKLAWQGVKNMIAGDLIPVFDESAKAMIEWIKANRIWLAQKIHIAIVEVVKVARSLAVVVWDIVEAVQEFAKWARGSTFAKIAAGFIAVGVAVNSPVLALGALIGAMALVINDFEAYSHGRKSLFGHLVEWAREFSDVLKIDPDQHPILAFFQSIIHGILHANEIWNGFLEQMADDLEKDGVVATAWNDLLIGPIEFWKAEFADFALWIAQTIGDAVIAGFFEAMRLHKQAFKMMTNPGDLKAAYQNLFVASPGAAAMVRSLEIHNQTQITLSGLAAEVNGGGLADQVAAKVDAVNQRNNRNAADAFRVTGATPGASTGAGLNTATGG